MFIAQTTQPTINLMDFLISLIPWVFVFLVVWFAVFRMVRRQNAHMARARDHWQALEAKLDRLIEIAERGQHGK